MADLLVSAEWEPHVVTLQNGMYASRFPGTGRTLWLLVNRTGKTLSGDQLAVPAGGKCFDLWHGARFPAAPQNAEQQRLSFEIEAHGYGAVLSTNAGEADEQLAKLLATMTHLSKQQLE